MTKAPEAPRPPRTRRHRCGRRQAHCRCRKRRALPGAGTCGVAGTPVAADPFRLESVPATEAASLQRQGARANAGGTGQARAVEAAPELSFPFTYLGKLERDGALDVYLDSGGTPMIAHPGQNLPGGWRFDGIEAGALAFTHISSNQKKTLSLKVTP